MSKPVLITALVASVLAVGAIAAVTATVIVDSGDGGARALRVQAAPGAAPALPQPWMGQGRGQGPFGSGFGRMQGLRSCLQQHGLMLPGSGTAPDPQKLRDALRSCLGAVPGAR